MYISARDLRMFDMVTSYKKSSNPPLRKANSVDILTGKYTVILGTQERQINTWQGPHTSLASPPRSIVSTPKT